MAKLRVIHNMVDTRCGITRRTGEVFEVNDEERIKELLDAKVVEEVKELGFEAKLEEYDFDGLYQFVIKVDNEN